MSSPTSRTLQWLRRAGWTADIVERWIGPPNGHKVRKDLFGLVDICGLRPGENGILGVQATSGSNTSHRRAKALEEPRLLLWLGCGNRFQVWGWRKLAKGRTKWQPAIFEARLSGGVVEWEQT